MKNLLPFLLALFLVNTLMAQKEKSKYLILEQDHIKLFTKNDNNSLEFYNGDIVLKTKNNELKITNYGFTNTFTWKNDSNNNIFNSYENELYLGYHYSPSYKNYYNAIKINSKSFYLKFCKGLAGLLLDSSGIYASIGGDNHKGVINSYRLTSDYLYTDSSLRVGKDAIIKGAIYANRLSVNDVRLENNSKISFFGREGDAQTVVLYKVIDSPELRTDNNFTVTGILNHSNQPDKPKIYRQSKEPVLPDESSAYWINTETGSWFLILSSGGVQKKLEMK